MFFIHELFHLFSRYAFVTRLSKPVIRSLMNLESLFFIQRFCIVCSRADIFLVVHYVLFCAVQNLSNNFQFLLVTNFIYLRACSFVLDLLMRTLMSKYIWLFVMIMTHTWSLFIVDWVIKFLDVVRKCIWLWTGFFKSGIVNSWAWDKFGFV